MGTMVALDIADPLPAAVLERLADDLFAWMRDVDARFSTFRADSEVCRTERRELAPADRSPHFVDVLESCAELWRETDGYFDVYATGRLDPSGYVKGWAAEVASARLASAGSHNHLVNAGGDVRVRGGPRPGERWRVPLRHPWNGDGAFLILAVTDVGVATSGTYERGFHVVDPRTGRPAHGLRSVTVVGADLGRADAYATAAVAMARAGVDWLAGLDGYEVAVVTEDGDGFCSAGLPVCAETMADLLTQRT